MNQIIRILYQLNTNQLKQLAREFGIKHQSNRKLSLIANLLYPKGQFGGYVQDEELPNIESVLEDNDNDNDNDNDEDNDNEIIDPNFFGINDNDNDNDNDNNNDNDNDNNNDNDNDNDWDLVLLNVQLNNRINKLERIIEFLSRAEIDVTDEDFRDIRELLSTAMRFLNELQTITEIDRRVINLIADFYDYLQETRNLYSRLRDRYYRP